MIKYKIFNENVGDIIFLIYKIYYNSPNGEFLAYLGRTKQPINSRLRGHFLTAPKTKFLDIFSVSHIEIAECNTEADMFIYEVYLINKLKPLLNRDDKALDSVTLSLPDIDFRPHTCKMLPKWKHQLENKNSLNTDTYEDDIFI